MQRIFEFFRILSSTAGFYREARHHPDFNWKEFVHGYIYARWPYLYISVGIGEHRLVKLLTPLVDLLIWWWFHESSPKAAADSKAWKSSAPKPQTSNRGTAFADTYHGKVLLPEAARKLVNLHQDINLTGLERVVPYAYARDVVLKHPDHIVLLDCPCRMSRPNPCRPVDVCLIIGEPFAGFTIEHHPQRSRWITQAEALDVLKASEARGNVHHAFFKKAMLGRFYAICNCCACCCGAMQARRNGVPMLASSGYVAEVDADGCAGCGACADICQFAAVSMDTGRAEVNAQACMGCGLCESRCPQAAIRLRRDPARGDPLDLDDLLAGADIAPGKTN